MEIWKISLAINLLILQENGWAQILKIHNRKMVADGQARERAIAISRTSRTKRETERDEELENCSGNEPVDIAGER